MLSLVILGKSLLILCTIENMILSIFLIGKIINRWKTKCSNCWRVICTACMLVQVVFSSKIKLNASILLYLTPLKHFIEGNGASLESVWTKKKKNKINQIKDKES